MGASSATALRIGLVGAGEKARARAEAIERATGKLPLHEHLSLEELTEETLLADFWGEVDVVFVAVSTAWHYRVAAAAAKQGVQVFLEWPPATSLREGEALAQLAEEARIEMGVSAPLRFHPVMAKVRALGRPRMVAVRAALQTGRPPWAHQLAEVVDLCSALARSRGVQRIEAEAVRGPESLPQVVAASLRFQNGMLAQLHLQQDLSPEDARLYIAGGQFEVEACLPRHTLRWRQAGEPWAVREIPAVLSWPEEEVRAYLEAVQQRRTAPVGVLDGLQTMRLVEKLMRYL